MGKLLHFLCKESRFTDSFARNPNLLEHFSRKFNFLGFGLWIYKYPELKKNLFFFHFLSLKTQWTRKCWKAFENVQKHLKSLFFFCSKRLTTKCTAPKISKKLKSYPLSSLSPSENCKSQMGSQKRVTKAGGGRGAWLCIYGSNHTKMWHNVNKVLILKHIFCLSKWNHYDIIG